MSEPQDSVDRLLDDWARTRPDLDFSPVAVAARLGRVRSHMDAELETVFAEHGLTGPSFAVLVTLARIAEPAGVTQRRLMDELGLTSGTISVRMDRLVDEGLVDRRLDPLDKRNTRITLTPAGRALFERVAPAHLENERRLLAALTKKERAELAGLLRKLLVEFEGSAPGPDAPGRLGISVSPAHVTIAMRRAVGLPPATGLLVRAVEADGPAAAAGLRAGDVLMRGGKRDLRSVASLYAALAEAAEGGKLRLRVLRGLEKHTLAVRLAAPRAGARSAPDEHLV